MEYFSILLEKYHPILIKKQNFVLMTLKWKKAMAEHGLSENQLSQSVKRNIKKMDEYASLLTEGKQKLETLPVTSPKRDKLIADIAEFEGVISAMDAKLCKDMKRLADPAKQEYYRKMAEKLPKKKSKNPSAAAEPAHMPAVTVPPQSIAAPAATPTSIPAASTPPAAAVPASASPGNIATPTASTALVTQPASSIKTPASPTPPSSTPKPGTKPVKKPEEKKKGIHWGWYAGGALVLGGFIFFLTGGRVKLKR
jgi:hypothetical protein